jgi:hypothetical protein
MTIFNFITVGKSIAFKAGDDVGNDEINPEAKLLETGRQAFKPRSIKDQLFAHTSQAIRFLQANDLVPPLPPQVDVVFTSVSLAEYLVNRVKGVFGRMPAPQYSHLACADPATATIYVSSSYLTNSNRYADFTTALQVLNSEFGGDIRKILEREFFHEMGHLALREKFKHKRSRKQDRGLLAVLKLNIEEGFADAFSLHLMGLKHPNQQQFPHLRTYMEGLSATLKTDQVSDVDVFRIYDMVPFTENGSVIADIVKVIDRSWRASLENSKEILLSKMTQNPYFKQDVMKVIDASTDDPLRIVEQLHKQVANEGFDTRHILAVRSFYHPKINGNRLKYIK